MESRLFQVLKAFRGADGCEANLFEEFKKIAEEAFINALQTRDVIIVPGIGNTKLDNGAVHQACLRARRDTGPGCLMNCAKRFVMINC